MLRMRSLNFDYGIIPYKTLFVNICWYAEDLDNYGHCNVYRSITNTIYGNLIGEDLGSNFPQLGKITRAADLIPNIFVVCHPVCLCLRACM